MNQFKDVKISQSFYTSNGQPSKKISNNGAISLVPELSGFDYQDANQDIKFHVYPSARIYGIGKAAGYRL